MSNKSEHNQSNIGLGGTRPKQTQAQPVQKRPGRNSLDRGWAELVQKNSEQNLPKKRLSKTSQLLGRLDTASLKQGWVQSV